MSVARRTDIQSNSSDNLLRPSLRNRRLCRSAIAAPGFSGPRKLLPTVARDVVNLALVIRQLSWSTPTGGVYRFVAILTLNSTRALPRITVTRYPIRKTGARSATGVSAYLGRLAVLAANTTGGWHNEPESWYALFTRIGGQGYPIVRYYDRQAGTKLKNHFKTFHFSSLLNKGPPHFLCISKDNS